MHVSPTQVASAAPSTPRQHARVDLDLEEAEGWGGVGGGGVSPYLPFLNQLYFQILGTSVTSWNKFKDLKMHFESLETWMTP